MSSQTKIALIAGDEVIDFKVLYCLCRAFSNIHIISNVEKSPIRYSRYKSNFSYFPWSVSNDNQQQVAQDIKLYCDQNEIEVIVTGGCDSAVFLHTYKDLFTSQKLIPSIDKHAMEAIDNKWLFTQILMSKKISTPYTICIETKDDVAEENSNKFEQKIGYPMIVKPIFGDGAQGVTTIHNFEQLQDHMLGNHLYNDLPLVAQEFIDGYDVGFSCIAKDGEVLCQSVQIVLDDDELDYRQDEQIESLGIEIIRTFNYSGPANIDMRIDHKTGIAYVFECNPRFWRTVTAAMWTGLNFAEVAVNVALGVEHKSEGAKGHYEMPGQKLKTLLKKPWSYVSMAKQYRDEIWFILTDPLPHLFSYFRHKYES